MSYQKGVMSSSFAKVPVTPGAALIAERLADRRADLADESPVAIDAAAVVIERLHNGLFGRAAAVSGDRTPRYRRSQLAGERSLPIEDLVYLAIVAPDEVVPAVALLGSLLERHTVEASIHEANGDVLRSFGEFEATLSESFADGVLSAEERLEITERLTDLVLRLRKLRPAVMEAKQ